MNKSSLPEYDIWRAMKDRVLNPNNARYKSYGGRGIFIDPSWIASFDAFISDVGYRPSKGYSLDRIDNDDGYYKENCRWTTPHIQMTNRTITRYVIVDGEQIPLATIAKENNIPANTLRYRILKGWDYDRAISEPVRSKMPNNMGRRRDWIKRFSN